MNRKGFTLIELLATLVIIALIMGIILPSASRISEDNKTKLYEEYEKMMVEYALVSELKGRNIIKLSELDELGKVKKDCNGYVQLVNTNPINYVAHIKCGTDYTSKVGYDESLAR